MSGWMKIVCPTRKDYYLMYKLMEKIGFDPTRDIHLQFCEKYNLKPKRRAAKQRNATCIELYWTTEPKNKYRDENRRTVTAKSDSSRPKWQDQRQNRKQAAKPKAAQSAEVIAPASAPVIPHGDNKKCMISPDKIYAM